MKQKKYFARFVFLIVTSTLFVMASLVYFSNFISVRLEQQFLNSLRDIANQNKLTIQREINANFRLLSGIAQEYTKNTDIVQNAKQIACQLEPLVDIYDYQDMGIILPDGTAYLHSGLSIQLGSRFYFQESMQGNFVLTEQIRDILDDVQINVYSVPIFSNLETQEIVGVLFASQKTKTFEDLLEIPSFNGAGYTYILTQTGDIVEDSSLSQKYKMENFFVSLESVPQNQEAIDSMQHAFAQMQDGYISYTYDVEKYAYFTPLDINNWWLMTIVPAQVLKDYTNSIMLRTRIICLLVSLFVASMAMIMLQRQQSYQLHLQRIAYQDALTQGKSLNYLQERWEHILRTHPKEHIALLVLDISKFKMINEIFGIKAGDFVLKQLHDDLLQFAYTDEIVTRGTADEFTMVCFYDAPYELLSRLDALLSKVKRVWYDGTELRTAISIGIYEIFDPHACFAQAYAKARIAKQKAKQNLSSPYVFFTLEMQEEEIRAKKLEDAIVNGLENREFCAWFQPKFDASGQCITSAEALVRWNRTDGSVASPFLFIPLCEKTGLIRSIDEMVFEDVCKKLSEWNTRGLPMIPISVNVSRAYIENHDTLLRLKQLMSYYKIPNGLIQLEITESSMMEHEEQLKEIIQSMHTLGFEVLLDDFGVGYSSLMSIVSMNFDVLKVDKTFVDAIGSPEGNFIVEYTIQLGKKLGMRIVAEGVEQAEQYSFLAKCGCDEIQGYYFSKPLPSQKFEELLQTCQC